MSRFHFEPGTVYLFTESRKDEPEYGLFGLFDCMDRGKIKLEAVQHRPCGLRYEEYLPDEYRYERKAKGDEIRDFCYLHGYDRSRISAIRPQAFPDILCCRYSPLLFVRKIVLITFARYERMR